MRHLKKIYLLIVFYVTTGCISAQEIVPATGGDASGTGGSSSYTVGQVGYTTNTGSNGSVAQGVQHPYEIFTSIGIEQTEINLELMAYPNPISNNLTLSVGNYNKEKLTYQFYDMQGKLLESRKVENIITIINMQKLPVSTYHLNILDNNSLIKTFDIIKITTL